MFQEEKNPGMPWASDMVHVHLWVTIQAFSKPGCLPLGLPTLDQWLETAPYIHLGNYDVYPASGKLVSLGLRMSELPKIVQSPVSSVR